ncbi:MAG: hypothetical protein JWM66_940 [Solirubrobacterales bacterium]|jgi:hypothetical protein|nr:hypothetical protein [Solirubrobacterales bacterium]
MRKLLTTIALLAASVVAISATPASASRSCGVLRLQGRDAVRVTIYRGPVSCAGARGIVKLYGTPKVGTFHGNPNGPRSGWYTTFPGGWTCGPLEQGSATCWLGGSPHNAAKARDLVGFVIVG